MRGIAFAENIVKDTAYAWRTLRASPGFLFTAVSAVALGVGVNTALFTIIYSMMLRPLPVKNPSGFLSVFIETRGEGPRATYNSRYFVSSAEYRHLRTHSKTAEIAAVSPASMSWKAQPALEFMVQLASDNLLGLAGAAPAAGRFFTPADTAPVIVLSHDTWRDYFGSDPAAVGGTMVLNRTQFTIVGVAADGVGGPLMRRPHGWIPYTLQGLTRPGESLVEDPHAGWMQLFARARGAHTAAGVQAELAVLAQQALDNAKANRTASAFVWPATFLDPSMSREGGPVIAILLLAVSLVLLVACANVANMLLARGIARRREIAVRLSIGASRARLVGQMLTESLLLAVLGGGCGLLLAQFAGGAILEAVTAGEIARHQIDVTPDGGILGYTLAVTLLTGLVFGLLPALRSSRVDLTPALKSSGFDAGSRQRRAWLQNGLVGVQVAAALVLLVNAGLLIRGFTRAAGLNPGFNIHNVLVADLDLRQQQYTRQRAGEFVRTLRRNVSSLPGIEAASMTFLNPLRAHCSGITHVVDAAGQRGPEIRIACDEVGPDFFKTMGMRVLQGRDFTEADGQGGANVAIVDQRFADLYLSGGAVGRRLRFGGNDGADAGIVAVVSDRRPLAFGRQAQPTVYRPMRGLRFMEAKIVAAHRGDLKAAAESVTRAAAALDPNVSIRIRTVSENAREVLMPVRMAAAAASSLGGLALLLAATGVYGVVAFAVRRRTKEVGIRMALGARRADVLRLVMAQAMKPVVGGAAAGIALALGGAQLIRAMLYGVSPLDPLSIGGTALLLVAVSALAILGPARAAVAVDPARTLRAD